MKERHHLVGNVVMALVLSGCGGEFAVVSPTSTSAPTSATPTHSPTRSPQSPAASESPLSWRSPSPTASPSRMPTLEPTPQGSTEFVHAWPDTNTNSPGLYSWDGTDHGPYVNEGFMHNGYGSGDVEIRMSIGTGDAAADSETPTTVAGYDGIHRKFSGRLDGRLEEWIVGIDGLSIAIRLEARPRTNQADLADAHAIVDSMRYEPQTNALGFRLVFRLTNSEWDSG
jgi:hypothetical protein